MSSIIPKSRQDVLKWIGINALIGFSIPAFFNIEHYFSLQGLGIIWDDMLYGFMMSTGISAAVGLNERFLDRHFPWLEQAGRRFFLEIIGISLLGFTASFAMNVLFFTLFGKIDYAAFPWAALAENALFPLYIGYGISTFFISKGFLRRAKAEAVRAEKLQTEKYRSEVRMLRDQLNPHFLFNALNVLTNVVYEDADRAADFIRQLSRFYRYVLEVQDLDLVPLEGEVHFCRDYLEVQKERFGGEALAYHFQMKNSEKSGVPPLALQLLMENALKHNRFSPSEPLHIEITQTDQWLRVRNNLQVRVNPSDHLGIGLSNLKKRYELLKAPVVEIRADEDFFTVSIPLIPLS